MGRGRPPEDGKTRGEVLCARISDDAVARVDALRGSRNRSAFVREAIREKIDREGKRA